MACVYAGCLSDYIYTKVFSESESVIITKLANSLFKDNGGLFTKSTDRPAC